MGKLAMRTAAKVIGAVVKFKKGGAKSAAKKHAALIASLPQRKQDLHKRIAEAFAEGGRARQARRIKAALEREEGGGGEPNKDDPQNCPLHRVSEGGLHRTKNVCGDYSSMGPLCSGCSVGQKEAKERAKAGGGASE
jgi:hypothetical protein